MHPLVFDIETRSPVDLRKCGTYVYFDNEHTDIWCAAYRFHGSGHETELWVPGEPCPPEIEDHINAGGKIVAHNANFERIAFDKIFGPRYGWPIPKITQYECTMAMCLALALPAGLENACEIVGAEVRKDAAGSRTMKQMAKPRRPRKGEQAEGYLWWDDPERLKTLYDYCITDVDAECALHDKILPLSQNEQITYWIDQKINDRGLYVDVELCNLALAIVDEAKERLDRELRHLTEGHVTSTRAVAQIKSYLTSKFGFDGNKLEDALVDVDWSLDYQLNKEALGRVLSRTDIPPEMRRVLELRQEGSRASVSKIEALLRGTQTDGRSRGLLQYHAASTGRWGGRRFQPQNIKRPETKDVDTAIGIIGSGDLDLVEAAYGDPLSVIGDCLRGMVRAAPGKELISADYSNVEGRVLAWCANEQWKLDAFRDFDAGEGADLYRIAYGRAFDKSPENVTGTERQVGKVMELALGYQGGVGAFMQMAAGYGVAIGEQHDFLFENAEPWAVDKVDSGWSSRGARSGINEETWRSAELVKVLWRDKHPETVSHWYEMEDAAIQAIENKGERVRCNRVVFFVKGSFLFMVRPSGSRIAYAFPKIVDVKTDWTDSNGDPVWKKQIQFKGTDSMTRKWVTQSTYGGKLVENECQSIARDLLAAALPRLELAGYDTVLTVHDEAVGEIDEGFGSVEEYESLMSELPEWADGLPLVAEGWRGERYRK